LRHKYYWNILAQKGREGKGREGTGREGKGRDGKGRLAVPSSFVSLSEIINFPERISQRYIEITQDPLHFSVAQGIF
jgi:hypothetical protein